MMNHKSLLAGACLLASLLTAAEIRPWNGSTEVAGNGKFKFAEAKALPLQSGKSYRVDCDVCKVPPVSPKSENHRLVLYCVAGEKIREIVNFGGEVPADGKKYHCAAAFTIPAGLPGEFRLFAYNCGAAGKLQVTALKLTELSDTDNIVIGPAKITAAAKTEKAVSVLPVADQEILADFGAEGVLTTPGTGQFSFRNKVIPLRPKAAYKISFDMRKEGEMSINPAEQRAVIILNAPGNRVTEFGYYGEKLPSDGQWHHIESGFVTPGGAGEFMFFLYNCNASGTIQVRNLKFTPVKALMPWGSDGPLVLRGDGKFLGRNFPVDLPAPGRTAVITFQMRKTAPLAADSIYHRAVLSYTTAANQNREILYLGDAVPADGQWHDVRGTLVIPADCRDSAKLNVYNCNASGTVEIRNWQAK